MGNEKKSSHILNASSNLLGICFIVLTSIRVFGQTQKTIIDDVTVVSLILFMSSCILSFLSIKNSGKSSSLFLERIADFCFLLGLFLLFIITILYSFNIVK